MDLNVLPDRHAGARLTMLSDCMTQLIGYNLERKMRLWVLATGNFTRAGTAVRQEANRLQFVRVLRHLTGSSAVGSRSTRPGFTTLSIRSRQGTIQVATCPSGGPVTLPGLAHPPPVVSAPAQPG